MSLPNPALNNGDDLYERLRAFGNSLRPADIHDAFFCQIVTELIDATLTNYRQLRQAFLDGNYPILAWVFTQFSGAGDISEIVLTSETSARRFGDDRLIDGVEIFTALKELELHYAPSTPTALLDEAIAQMRAQMAAENVTQSRHLVVGRLADQVGLGHEIRTMNRVSSKLVHPTAWSVLSVNSELNSFPGAKDILFISGVGYMVHILIDAREHNEQHGLRPKP